MVRFTAHAGVVVREGVEIGDRVTLHAGVVLGSDGFGYLPLPDVAMKPPNNFTNHFIRVNWLTSRASVDEATRAKFR